MIDRIDPNCLIMGVITWRGKKKHDVQVIGIENRENQIN